jgi:hypothetical protein
VWVAFAAGLSYRNRTLHYGDDTRVDDDLVLYFTREVDA